MGSKQAPELGEPSSDGDKLTEDRIVVCATRHRLEIEPFELQLERLDLAEVARDVLVEKDGGESAGIELAESAVAL